MPMLKNRMKILYNDYADYYRYVKLHMCSRYSMNEDMMTTVGLNAYATTPAALDPCVRPGRK